MPNLTNARTRVATLMIDECHIVHHSGIAQLDATTGSLNFVDALTTPFYRGSCFVTHPSAFANAAETLGVEALLNRYGLYIPWDAPPVELGDHVVIDTSGDPSLVGTRFVVRSVVRSSLLIWRELGIEVLETDRG